MRDNKENKIESWDLSIDHRVNADIAKALAEYVSVTSALTSLNLSKCDLNAEGAAVVADALTRNSSLQTLDVDGCPLEIKKLRGAEPVESIDLSMKGLTVLSAVTIASLMPLNTATKSLDIGHNSLKVQGVKVVANMLAVNTTLTSVDLESNSFGAGYYDENHIFQSDYSGVEELADALKSNGGLRTLHVKNNELDESAKEMLKCGCRHRLTSPKRDVRGDDVEARIEIFL